MNPTLPHLPLFSANILVYPDTLGVKMAVNSSLTWDVHVHPAGKEVPFRIDVAFKFHPKWYKAKYSNSATFGSLSYDLHIPAGDSNVRIDGFYTLPKPGLLLFIRAASALERQENVCRPDLSQRAA